MQGKWILAVTLICMSGIRIAKAESILFPVATVNIGTGDTISDDMLVERRLIANSIAQRTYFTSRTALVGKVAKRPIQIGAAIPINGVRDAYAFKEGERIKLQFLSGKLSINGAGIALQPGIVGQFVRVRNDDTGVIVSGVVKADGSVEVGGV